MLESLVSAAREAMSDWKKPSTSNHNGWQDMLHRNWHLGLTSFGGPAVHFQIVSRFYQIPLHGHQEQSLTLAFLEIVPALVCGKVQMDR
jgi:hypothetical protein